MKALLGRILCLALAMVITAGLFAGCQSGGNKTEIEILTWHGPDSATNYYKGYEQAAKDYMKTHSNVNIKIKYEQDSTYGSILETGFAGGTAPDIIQMKSGQRLTYSQNLLNLRDYLNEENPYDKRSDKWINNFINEDKAIPVEANATDANAWLIVPNDGNPNVYAGRIYVFNTSLIKKAGLDPQKTPTTWKEMFEWLEALAGNAEVAPIAGSSDLGGKVSQIGNSFGPDYQDKFFSDDITDEEFTFDLYYDKLYVLTCYDKGTDMPLDNLPYYPALFKLMKQHLSYYQTSWAENSPETEILTFANGKSAMITSSFWDYDALTTSLSDSKFPDGYGIFQFPYMTDDTLDYAVEKGWITQEESDAAKPYANNKPTQHVGIESNEMGFSVNAKLADNKEKLDAAIDFLKYFSSYDAQSKYVETAQSLSPVKDVKIIDMMNNFIRTSSVGYVKNILGYTVIEWGKSGWDVDLMKFIKGEADWQSTVQTISAPEWVGDIPTVEALAQAVTDAEAEVKSASADTKADKERALKFAQLRQKLYTEYFYDKTGNLKEIK